MAMENLFRMENVATHRRDRITSDEEERQRIGYELKTSVRFAERAGRVSAQEAKVLDAKGEELARLSYGAAATIWRMNIGWRRRAHKEETGFVLDIERGYWARSQDVDDDPEDPMSPRQVRVIPYVEDRKNCLLVDSAPIRRMGTEAMASFAAALKVAIQVRYQLEDSELAAEPLPSEDDRQTILFYEAAEGGAGVLRRLVEDEHEFRQVARRALEVCHYDPETLVDRERSEGAKEACEAACYDCLLSYYNQREHQLLDRRLLPELLQKLSTSSLRTSPRPVSREIQYTSLSNLAESDLEREWLQRVYERGLRLPTAGQETLEQLGVRPDFIYEDQSLTVFVDGPAHDGEDARAKDQLKTRRLEEAGYFVLRFRYDDDWDEIFARHEGVFGTPSQTGPADAGRTASDEEESKEADPTLDLDLFEDDLHSLLRDLVEAGYEVHPGEDIAVDGRVVGMIEARIRGNGVSVALVRDSSDDETLTSAIEGRGLKAVLLSGSDDFERIQTALES